MWQSESSQFWVCSLFVSLCLCECSDSKFWRFAICLLVSFFEWLFDHLVPEWLCLRVSRVCSFIRLYIDSWLSFFVKLNAILAQDYRLKTSNNSSFVCVRSCRFESDPDRYQQFADFVTKIEHSWWLQTWKLMIGWRQKKETLNNSCISKQQPSFFERTQKSKKLFSVFEEEICLKK